MKYETITNYNVNILIKEKLYPSAVNRFNGITSYKLVDWANESDLELLTDSTGNPDLGSGCSIWVSLCVLVVVSKMETF